MVSLCIPTTHDTLSVDGKIDDAREIYRYVRRLLRHICCRRLIIVARRRTHTLIYSHVARGVGHHWLVRRRTWDY